MKSLAVQILINLVTIRAKINAQNAYQCVLAGDKQNENGYLCALRAQNEILDLMGAKQVNHLDYYK